METTTYSMLALRQLTTEKVVFYCEGFPNTASLRSFKSEALSNLTPGIARNERSTGRAGVKGTSVSFQKTP